MTVEQIEDEDEVLSVLADELGNFVDHVGGPDHAAALLAPLEQVLSTTCLRLLDSTD